MPSQARLLAGLILVAIAVPHAPAGEPNGWNKNAAAQYLDGRCNTWFEFARADRGQDATKTSCVCCHTIVPYALARPVLRKLAGTGVPTDLEKKLLAQTTLRVENWANLDTPAYRLLYDFSEDKKKESLGTEAVLNALMLACDDGHDGRVTPSNVTRKAMANLWQMQLADGPHKGSWDWLNFGFEPWEGKGGRYYGAALAAVAIASAPGYYSAGTDPNLDAKVSLLRVFLKEGVASQNLYNRAWALWAAARLDGILSAEERKTIIAQLLAKQRADGGWALSSLGTFQRMDSTPEEATSDGYATGLVLHILQASGVPKNDPKVSQGLGWLKKNQQASGAWPGSSLNKKRDPETHIGKFMADAATGYAVLALSH